jgi:hypothetical protein
MMYCLSYDVTKCDVIRRDMDDVALWHDIDLFCPLNYFKITSYRVKIHYILFIYDYLFKIILISTYLMLSNILFYLLCILS